MKRPLLCIAGPTASGKTGVGIRLAQVLDGEIISADARQVYRRLEIGTARPTAAERAAAPHHLIDFVEPDEEFHAARFVEEAERAIEDVRSRGKLPIVVGGVGLYFRALIEGLDVTVGRDEALRQELKGRIEREGPAALHGELAHVDPESAAAIHPNDAIRIVRALEIHRLTGVPQSEHHRRGGERRHEARMAGLAWSREALYERIDSRFDRMMEDGLLDEVRSLLDRGCDPGLSCFRSPGYRELIAHIGGQIDLDEAVERGRRESRRFAKRQLTWFRKEKIEWFDVARLGGTDATARAIASWYQDNSPPLPLAPPQT